MGSILIGVAAVWLAWLGNGQGPVPSTLMTLLALALAVLMVLLELDRLSRANS